MACAGALHSTLSVVAKDVEANKAGSSNEVLRDAVGLEFTMPLLKAIACAPGRLVKPLRLERSETHLSRPIEVRREPSAAQMYRV